MSRAQPVYLEIDQTQSSPTTKFVGEPNARDYEGFLSK